jgi:Cytochrome C and Quinol oxidase polypeptide I
VNDRRAIGGAPVNFQIHNSAFLVAHFTMSLSAASVFGAFAGYQYWFPKAFGFTLDERWGNASFWCWLIGFYLAFTPLYALGLMRSGSDSTNNILAFAFGVLIIFLVITGSIFILSNLSSNMMPMSALPTFPV